MTAIAISLVFRIVPQLLAASVTFLFGAVWCVRANRKRTALLTLDCERPAQSDRWERLACRAERRLLASNLRNALRLTKFMNTYPHIAVRSMRAAHHLERLLG